MKKLILLILLNSTMTMFMKHPISMGSILMTQTFLTCILTSFLINNSWMSFILILTMLGGMMILFTYMASILSNKKFKPSKTLMISTLILILSTLLTNYKFLDTNINEPHQMIINPNEQAKTIMKFFSSNKSNLTLMLILILLIVLISITSTCSSFSGPLKKTYETYTKKN